MLGLARQLGLGWDTVWSGIEPILSAAAADESRFNGVTSLGVDEHVWHHVSTKAPEDGGRGPKELTGMVDLTCDENGQVRARLLDLVPGRSKKAYADWLTERGADFTAGVKVATEAPAPVVKGASTAKVTKVAYSKKTKKAKVAVAVSGKKGTATGKATITIKRGKATVAKKVVSLKAGKASWTSKKIVKKGTYKVTVKYAGSKTYKASKTSKAKSFKIKK